MRNKITSVSAFDIRFPTSEHLDGSDAMNKDPDYSAAYIVIETASGDRGFSLIFTIGRGNDICCRTVEAMRDRVVGTDLADIKADMGRFYDELRSDSQLRWLGPEKGVVHMAVGGIVNAVWDLWARDENKPVWRLLAGMSPEEFVNCVDLRYVTDVLTRDEAIALVARNIPARSERIRFLEQHGYPAYTTSAGWLGYDDEKLVRLCRESVAQGFRHIKLKVGQDLDDDIRRCRLAREAIGPDVALMIDANQTWEVDQAIDWTRALAEFRPWFIEEPTSPDDVMGHRKIRQGIANGIAKGVANSIGDIKVATGEHCQNRILFKQFIASDAIDVVQVDACRLAGLNEVLTVYLLAAKFGKPVCPHAGGVGLCEYVQHMSMIDYVMISGEIGERVIEYVDHLHEHFVDPCIVRDGAYRTPSAPGFSVQMKPDSVSAFEYPHGAEWRARRSQAL